MRAFRVGLGCWLLLVAGCAASSKETQAKAPAEKRELLAVAEQQPKKTKGDPGEKIICEETQVVGSHIPTLLCRSVRSIEAERQSSQNFLDSPKGCTQCANQAIGLPPP
jgi:hypothetical protein